MFDRHGNALSYPTEEAMLNILRGDQLDLENMRSIFKQAMMVDAASHGWNDAIDVMMDLGFSADDTDHKNYTPLGYAAMKGQTDTVVRLLFEYGADVTACNNFGPSMFDSNEWFEGYTALELALERNHFATAILLVRAGSSLEANILQMIYSNPEEHPVIDDFNYATKRPVEARLFELALERGKYSDAKGMVQYLEHTIKLILFEHPRLQTILEVTEAHIAELNLQGDVECPRDTLAYMDESFGADFLFKRLDHICHKRAARNWLKARKAVMKRWIVEYWRDCTARSHLERDRQVEVQAMAELESELMPPSLPPSPPESEAGDDVAVNSSGSVSGDEFGDDPDPEDYSDDPSESGSQPHSDASINLGEEINEMVTQQMHAADDAIVDREHHQPLSRLIAMYYAVMGVQEGFIAITDDNVDMALGPFWEAFRHRGVSKAQLMDAIRICATGQISATHWYSPLKLKTTLPQP